MSEAAPATPWVLPPVDGPVVGAHRRRADLDAIERQAWEEGFEEGRQAGIKAGQKQCEDMVGEQRRLLGYVNSICALQSAPLAELDENVVQQLAGLAAAIARQVVRRELSTHPEQIITVIRETLALLPGSAREVRVVLHPEDAALVNERLAESQAERAWNIVEDPMLSRGGCRIQSQNSTIDARVESRLAAAIGAILGDARAQPRNPTQDPTP
ncbi:MAG TPA: FliH/SctL family protein [Steroidobacteraceae bacterium]|nr:FliH/SctL family protein [Steroidobacteraceae bacterium]